MWFTSYIPFGQDALSIREGNRGNSVEHHKALIQIQICKVLQQCSNEMTENGWTALFCTAVDQEQPCWSQWSYFRTVSVQAKIKSSEDLSNPRKGFGQRKQSKNKGRMWAFCFALFEALCLFQGSNLVHIYTHVFLPQFTPEIFFKQ